MSVALRARLSGALVALVLATVSAATAASAASVRNLHIETFAPGAGFSHAAPAKAAEAAFLAGTDLAVFGAGGHFGTKSMVAEKRTETFAGFSAWNGTSGTQNPVTSVGSFTSLGGKGTGHSAVNGGTALEVRNNHPFGWGRFSTETPGLGNWLDSNDTFGMRWEVGGLGSFNALSFLLTDVGDVGAKFSLRIGSTLYEHVIGGSGPRPADGTIHWVRILLEETVDSLVVEMRNDRLNDGFGIDRATVARIAPIPLPPAALLLVAGGLALFGVGRRKAQG